MMMKEKNREREIESEIMSEEVRMSENESFVVSVKETERTHK